MLIFRPLYVLSSPPRKCATADCDRLSRELYQCALCDALDNMIAALDRLAMGASSLESAVTRT